MKDCPLCDKNSFKFYITFCRTCKGVPMIVLIEHRANFTEQEKKEIQQMFPNRKIRWQMRKILDHAHCHLE